MATQAKILIGALFVGCALALWAIASLWNDHGQAIETELRLSHMVGEINRIDEVLTMSSRMYAATGEPRWQGRYEAHVTILDDLISETLSFFPEDTASSVLEQTKMANLELVRMEVRSFAMVARGEREAASALLSSKRYLENKIRYAEGMKSAMRRLTDNVRRERQVERTSIAAVLVSIVLLSLALMLTLQRMNRAETIEMRRRTQVETMRMTLNTSMDIVNNILNGMIYIRHKIEARFDFDESDLRLIDTTINDATDRMNTIVESDMPAPRDLGGITILEPVRRQA